VETTTALPYPIWWRLSRRGGRIALGVREAPSVRGGRWRTSTISLTLAGAEIREDHLRIERAMHPYTGGVFATPR
jgi:hypothetical protein